MAKDLWIKDCFREFMPYTRYSHNDGDWRLVLIPDRRHANYLGSIVHGAILTSLADTAACNFVVQITGHTCITKEIHMSLHRPALIGKEIIATPSIGLYLEAISPRQKWVDVELEQAGIMIAKAKIMVCTISLESHL